MYSWTILERILIIVATVPLLLLGVLYIYFKCNYTYWSRKNVPHLRPSFPFGSAKELILRQKSPGDFFAHLYRQVKLKTKVAGGLYLFGKPVLMIINPELMKSILTKEFDSFHDRDLYMDEENDPLSAQLIALRGNKWRKLRAKLTPTFTAAKLKLMFHTITESTKDLEHVIKTHINRYEPVDIKNIFSRLTTDTIMSCAFGIECSSLKEPNNEFRRYGKKIFDITMREVIINIIYTTFPWLLKRFRIMVTKPDVGRFFLNSLRNILEHREKNNIHRKDFLDLFIRLKNNQSVLDDDTAADIVNGNAKQGLTFNELAAQAFVFFAAGFETTSSTLCFCMYELAMNPEVQRKLKKEILDVYKERGDNAVSYDAVMSMKYMDQVVNEVLRKYPSIIILPRICTKDYKIPEMSYTIKEGTAVVISTLGLHRDPEYYPDPETFDPERFSEEEKSKRHPCTYLPFGEGPRNCIGMRFALLQVKLVLSLLLKQFEFTLDSKTELPLQFDPKTVFLAPKKPIWLQAHIVK